MPRKKVKFSLAPDIYRKILSGISLDRIYLFSLKVDFNDSLKPDGIELKIKEKPIYVIEENNLIITYEYELQGISTNDNIRFFKIKSIFKIIYYVENPDEIDDEFFDIFSHFTLEMLMWPYFRELVQNITSRMSIPPLTLPMRRK
ncbi:MAG: hypothetical protein GXO77_09840 [Calditrichaeota bacterium]|nr:hypothetical protein [Calditrichota bacterium]